MTNKPATRSSWKNKPILKLSKGIACNYVFNDQEYAKVIRGILPELMEDKWFVYHEDNWLYFHRSWTGKEMFRANIVKEQNTYCIKEYFVEEDEYEHRLNDSYSLFDILIKMLLRVS